MFEVNKLVRENIKKLQPYSSARHEFKGEASVFLDANEKPEIEIRNLQGKIIKTLDFSFSSNNNEINTSEIISGIYFLQIKTTKTSLIKKLIVQH